MAGTITQTPMKYTGTTIYGKYYGIYQYDSKTFSIPFGYYEAFQFLGSFISGQDAILFKWAEFSVQASGHTLSTTQVLNEVLRSPVTERDILESKALYRQILKTDGKVRCVWSGDIISRYDIDHIIPFTIWKNNDLWNLLPARTDLNNQKRDKIPSPVLIDNQTELILHYWDLLHQHKQQRFRKELQTALLGYHTTDNWQQPAITQLKHSCDYLITTRGFEAWNGR
ncbi:HNH endonuclease domain-containing protein [Mucilaginibacter sp. PPCGB 2223]|uniref:HNH endonuclease domain-containing protein n=1 Tax=Mucilaginibacter sp. PPCGB 2223 TaxID=1886027 RepID=UPI0015867825|nr:HNH endonuclease domain-containing protein [Mucilaginibacter sp. PPCGB 2223]